MNVLDNLSGRTFGIYEVLEFDHMKQLGTNGKHGMSYYKCLCTKCGKILIVPRSQLIQEKNILHRNCGK
jgi:hypothetical protein